ncbi:lipoprotein [Mangrovibacter sp. MFB070]|uniref:amidase activator ActS n=1 Tax=Mangrovibacter sp. MFB070 TaxID=1224318 RepID=UPI0004D6E96D|nr:amidase activator ActS [Mangrovibacter sp. MFB070]KEA54529.1 lipoprotein [Mangrovibacter sp. MFB070]
MSSGITFSHWLRPIICLFLALSLAACSGSASRSNASISGSTYTVQRGDTLYRIALRSGNSVGTLARLNGLSSPYTIQVGQRLRLSGSSPSKTVTPKASTKTTTTARSSSASQPEKLAPANWPSPGSKCWRWPTQGKVVDGWSSKDGGNKGIDIAGTLGQPVYAAAAGRVVYAGDQLRGYGNLILIKHDENYITAYGHNQSMLVTNGQQVKAGQKIATMGSTGTNTVKLHFQIRYKATALDPLRYLPPQGKSPSC